LIRESFRSPYDRIWRKIEKRAAGLIISRWMHEKEINEKSAFSVIIAVAEIAANAGTQPSYITRT